MSLFYFDNDTFAVMYHDKQNQVTHEYVAECKRIREQFIGKGWFTRWFLGMQDQFDSATGAFGYASGRLDRLQRASNGARSIYLDRDDAEWLKQPEREI